MYSRNWFHFILYFMENHFCNFIYSSFFFLATDQSHHPCHLAEFQPYMVLVLFTIILLFGHLVESFIVMHLLGYMFWYLAGHVFSHWPHSFRRFVAVLDNFLSFFHHTHKIQIILSVSITFYWHFDCNSLNLSFNLGQMTHHDIVFLHIII